MTNKYIATQTGDISPSSNISDLAKRQKEKDFSLVWRACILWKYIWKWNYVYLRLIKWMILVIKIHNSFENRVHTLEKKRINWKVCILQPYWKLNYKEFPFGHFAKIPYSNRSNFSLLHLFHLRCISSFLRLFFLIHWKPTYPGNWVLPLQTLIKQTV